MRATVWLKYLNEQFFKNDINEAYNKIISLNLSLKNEQNKLREHFATYKNTVNSKTEF